MIAYLAVFIGGGTGSLLRFAISNWYAVLPASFPYGTLISNVASCVILGFLSRVLRRRPSLAAFAGAHTVVCGLDLRSPAVQYLLA